MSKIILTPTRINYILWVILILCLVIPAITPIGIPISIDPEVKNAYDIINNLPERSIVFFSEDGTAGGWSEMGSIAEALLQHLLSRNLRIVFVAIGTADGPVMVSNMLSKYRVDKIKTYGVDYVVIGYIPGGFTAAAALAEDVWKAAGRDYYGNSFDQLPLMKEVHSANDVSLLITIDNTSGTEYYATQWWAKYKTKIIAAAMVMMYSYLRPYRDAGQVVALLAGVRAGAGYEKLLNAPGFGLASTDMMSLTHVFMLIAVIVSNVIYYRSKKVGGQK
jgi:hypothetical protein